MGFIKESEFSVGVSSCGTTSPHFPLLLGHQVIAALWARRSSPNPLALLLIVIRELVKVLILPWPNIVTDANDPIRSDEKMLAPHLGRGNIN